MKSATTATLCVRSRSLSIANSDKQVAQGINLISTIRRRCCMSQSSSQGLRGKQVFFSSERNDHLHNGDIQIAEYYATSILLQCESYSQQYDYESLSGIITSASKKLNNLLSPFLLSPFTSKGLCRHHHENNFAAEFYETWIDCTKGKKRGFGEGGSEKTGRIDVFMHWLEAEHSTHPSQSSFTFISCGWLSA